MGKLNPNPPNHAASTHSVRLLLTGYEDTGSGSTTLGGGSSGTINIGS